ncbi:hypothetical protein BDN72DRAFT_753732 [Pluteus cervinus]|uniref:Uncharacterized protein n=1 Tax=Pluteus cervinus TaxID=181527 RepID=A0ACD3BFS9_9AGAR|nr:hypothetical protein BDN72DRAFT_753732 [Pluteus cervinus]
MFASTLSLGLAVLPFISAAIIDVQVGAGGKLEFDPPAIGAQPGDQVVFHFNPKNHTVTQSSFASPCGRKDGGIDSGFMPVAANQTDNLPTYTVSVPDTNPIWIYCAQAANTPNSHCGAGMVFAINCGADGAPNSFTNFKASALAIGASLSASAAAASATPASGGYVQTAAYGGYTLPPAPSGQLLTETISVDSSTWVTTYTSYPNSPAPTPASLSGIVHKVIVGGSSGLVFDPPHIQALPRDQVVFEFHDKNHTVTQSSFADPCRKLSANGATGFDSGFFPVDANATQFPTWTLTVNDTAPIWAYCRQQTPKSHCGSGMVFAINSDEQGARNYSAFLQVAEALNGTAAAANSPTTPASSASSARIAGSAVAGVVALLIASLL